MLWRGTKFYPNRIIWVSGANVFIYKKNVTQMCTLTKGKVLMCELCCLRSTVGRRPNPWSRRWRSVRGGRYRWMPEHGVGQLMHPDACALAVSDASAFCCPPKVFLWVFFLLSTNFFTFKMGWKRGLPNPPIRLGDFPPQSLQRSLFPLCTTQMHAWVVEVYQCGSVNCAKCLHCGPLLAFFYYYWLDRWDELRWFGLLSS